MADTPADPLHSALLQLVTEALAPAGEDVRWPWRPVGSKNGARDFWNPATWVQTDFDAVREESRRLFNHCEFAIGGALTRKNYVVGQGFKYEVVPLDESRAVDPGVLREFNSFVDAFCKLNRLAAVEKETQWRDDRDGETFLRLFDAEGDDIPAVRFVEPERVGEPGGDRARSYEGDDGPPPDTSQALGVCTPKRDGQTVLGYWVSPAPGEPVEWVPEREIVHLKCHVDSSCRRGLPVYFPVVENLRRAEDTLQSMGTMAKARAKIALVEYVQNLNAERAESQKARLTTGYQTMPDGTARQTTIEEIPFGARLRVPASSKLEFPSANVGASDLVGVLQADLRAVAKLLDMPEWMFTGLADQKYSNAFVVEAPTLKAFSSIQGDLVQAFGEGRYRQQASLVWRAIRLACERNILPASALPSLRVKVTPPSLEVRDKAAEASVNQIYVGMGAKSLRKVIEEQGGDPDQVFREVAEEKAGQQSAQPAASATGPAAPAMAGGAPVTESAANSPPPPPSPPKDEPWPPSWLPDWLPVGDDPPDADEDGEPVWYDEEAPLDEDDPDANPTDPNVKESAGQGRTGEFKDKRGRRMCYDNGKRVRCPERPEAKKPGASQARFRDNADHPAYTGTGESWDRPTWSPAGKTTDGRLRWMHAESGRVQTGDRPAEPSADRKKAAHAERVRRLAQPPTVTAPPPDLTPAVDAAFGDRGKDGVVDLLGLGNGTAAALSRPWAGKGVNVSLEHPDVDQWSRTVTPSDDGTLSVSNNLFFLKPGARGKNFGTTAFADQVRGMVKEGGKEITTTAGKGGSGGDKMNGYYTWARLGYDAELTPEYRARLPESLRAAATVQDLMGTKEGASHWRDTGYMARMRFDTSPGSRSIQVLNNYLTSKGQPAIDDGPEIRSERQRKIDARRERMKNLPAVPPPPPPAAVSPPPPPPPPPAAVDPGEEAARRGRATEHLLSPDGRRVDARMREAARELGLDEGEVAKRVLDNVPVAFSQSGPAATIGWYRSILAAGVDPGDRRLMAALASLRGN